MFGDYERLDKRINHDLRARSAAELYEIVLERIETVCFLFTRSFSTLSLISPFEKMAHKAAMIAELRRAT